MPVGGTANAVDLHFTCSDEGVVCDICGWHVKTATTRRKLEHLLGRGTTVSGCKSAKSTLDVDTMELIKKMLDGLDCRIKCRNQKRTLNLNEAKLPLPKRLRQTKLKTVTENDVITMDFARMAVMATCRKSFFNNPWVHNFFVDNFGFKPPSRRTIIRDLVPLIYKETERQVTEICNFSSNSNFCTLATDGWQSPDGQHLRNYMIVIQNATFLHSTTLTGTRSMNAQEIATEVDEAISSIGKDNVVALVTDNASAETTAWDIVRNDLGNDDVLCTGCVVHGGSLLFKDVIKCHKFGFETVDKANDLVSYLRSHQWLLAKVREKSNLTVKYHCATRLAGSYFTMQRLLKLKSTIRAIAATEEYDEKAYPNADRINRIINSKQFWTDLRALNQFLRPLKNFIRTMDADRHMSEHVYPLLKDLTTKWTETPDEPKWPNVPAGFRAKALRELKTRWDWMEFDIHRAAYVLSPYYQADDIENITKLNQSVQAVISLYCSDLEDTSKTACGSDLARFKVHPPLDPEIFPPRGQSAHLRSSLPSLDWWRIYGSQWPHLQKIAFRVFSAGCTSSMSERNWSHFGHIWNKRSSGYTHETAHKLCYIKYNSNAIQQYRVSMKTAANTSSTVEEVNSEDEITEGQQSSDSE